MNRLTVLYLHNSAQIAGGNKVLLGLYEHLDRTRFEPVAVLPSEGPMQDELRKAQVPYGVAPIDLALRQGGRFVSLQTTLSLLGTFLTTRPHIVHANGPHVYRFASIVARWTQASRICHLHLLSEAVGAVKWAFRVIPHLVLTPTKAMAAEVAAVLSTSNIPADVVPVLNSIPIDRFVPVSDQLILRAGLGLSHFSHLITIVGLVCERKGHSLFLAVAARLLQRFPRVGFLVVGEDLLQGGAYRRHMEALAVELGIREQVIFYGFLDEPDVRNIVAASDVVTLPSFEESFALSLAEAQASGVPVISTILGPIQEVVEDGVTGILVPPGDIDALYEAVVTLLENDHRRIRMGREARDRAVRLFAQNRFAREVEALYTAVLDRAECQRSSCPVTKLDN